jgi:hypothetical protein
MADFYYNLRVISCRGQHDTLATGNNDFISNEVPGRPIYEFAYAAEGVAAEANGTAAFVAAFQADVAANAPKHIDLLDATILSSRLLTAATEANDSNSNTGKFFQRVGKDVLRYEIGVSQIDAADAVDNRTAHKLV